MGLLVLLTRITYPFKINRFPQYSKIIQDRRCLYIAEIYVIDIYDLLAPEALKMLMIFQMSVKPLGIAGSLYGKGGADLIQRQQRPVNRIHGNMGKNTPDRLEDVFRRWMLG